MYPTTGDRPPHEEAGHSDIPTAVQLLLVRLEGKVDSFIQTQAVRDEVSRNQYSDHENRLRTLEAKRYVEPRTVWTAFGIFATVGSLVVAIINLATK